MKDIYTIHAKNGFISGFWLSFQPHAVEYEVKKNNELAGSFIIAENRKSGRMTILEHTPELDRKEIAKCVSQNKAIIKKNFDIQWEFGRQERYESDFFYVEIPTYAGRKISERLAILNDYVYSPLKNKEKYKFTVTLKHHTLTVGNKTLNTIFKRSQEGKNDFHVELYGSNPDDSMWRSRWILTVDNGVPKIDLQRDDNKPLDEDLAKLLNDLFQSVNLLEKVNEHNTLPFLNSH